MWPAISSSRNAEGSRSIARHRGQRPAVAALQRQRVGRGHRALDRDRRQRLAPGKVEVDGPRAGLTAGRRQRPAGDRAVVEQPVVVGLVGPDFAEPAHRGAEELDLVDRLAGADPAQLRRPVGAEDDQRHAPIRRPRRPRGGSWRPRCPRCRAAPPASPRRLRGAEGEEGRPSARRRSPSPRSRAGARAPPPAASSASRGRRPRGAGRRARAPRRRPRRVRCWRWSGPRRLATFSAIRRIKRQCRLKPMGVERLLVDLDAEARARGGDAACRRASTHSTDGDGRGEETLGGEAVGEVEALRAVGVLQGLGDLRRGGDPDRPVERAGDVGGQDVGDLDGPARARRPWRA